MRLYLESHDKECCEDRVTDTCEQYKEPSAVELGAGPDVFMLNAGWEGKSREECRSHSGAQVHSSGNPHQFSLEPPPILLSLSPIQPLLLTLFTSPPRRSL